MKDEEAVQAGTIPVRAMRPNNAVNQTTGDQTTQTETPAQPAEQQTTEQPAEQQTTEQTTQPTEQTTQIDPARIAEEVANRMQQNTQAQLNASSDAGDITFEQQVEQQKEEIQSGSQEQLSKIDQSKADLTAKLENGDIQMNQYLAENERLNQQRYQTEREMDRQLMGLDSQLNQHRAQLETQIQQDRKAFAAQHPDFVEMYNQGQINQAMQDQGVRNVFGDNPAAVYQMLKAQNLASENEQLKTELASLKEQQQQAVSQAAANPNAKVGDQGGGMHPGTSQTAQQQAPSDPMLAAIKATREQMGGAA